jgi:hypothetical protein
MTFPTFVPAIPIQCFALDAIEKSATAFGKPVLLIHGDNHYFSIEPLKNGKGRPTPGVNNSDTLVHGFRALRDPDPPGVSGFTPLIIPENGFGCTKVNCGRNGIHRRHHPFGIARRRAAA